MFKQLVLGFLSLIISTYTHAGHIQQILLAQNSDSEYMQNYLEQLQTNVHNEENASQNPNINQNQNTKPNNNVPQNPYLKPNPWGNTTENPYAPAQPNAPAPTNQNQTPTNPGVFGPAPQPTQPTTNQPNQQNQPNQPPKNMNIYQQ